MIKNKKGFTLAEIIIAIAALSLCSVVILNIFIAGNNLSIDADMYDEAINRSGNMAETFKSSKTFQDFINTAYLDEYFISKGEINATDFLWIYCFDKNWNYLDSTKGASVILEIELGEDIKYKSGDLWKLKINFNKINNEEQVSILEIITKRYYPRGTS